jgi:hypothetical protein
MRKIMGSVVGVIVAALVSASCGGAEDGEEVGQIEEGLASANCPYVPSHPYFMYAVNYCGSQFIKCWSRNSSWQMTSVNVNYPSGTSSCCATGYCPDQRCGQLTYISSWSCS